MKDRKYRHFRREERDLIYQMRSDGKSFREIAKALGRGAGAAGSVKRELTRNKHFFPGIERRMTPLERSRHAHEKALKRRRIPRKRALLECHPELKKRILELLTNEQASPRDIAFRLRDELPGRSIAYTTIYNFTKHDRTDLKKHLRLRGKPRRQRVKRRRNRFQEGAPPKTNIKERPAWVGQRTEFGHFEADTIHSCKNGSGYATLSVRELKSRHRWYFLIADLKAETTLAVLQGFFRLLPSHMRKTLTVDNGPENEHLYKLESVFPGFKVYFCDPYCAWQRGAIENANKEFRWYHPKGTDFSNLSVQEVWKTQDKLNRRRMICLGGKSAETVFQQASKLPPLVHLAGAHVLASSSALAREVGSRSGQSLHLFPPLITQWG